MHSDLKIELAKNFEQLKEKINTKADKPDEAVVRAEKQKELEMIKAMQASGNNSAESITLQLKSLNGTMESLQDVILPKKLESLMNTVDS